MTIRKQQLLSRTAEQTDSEWLQQYAGDLYKIKPDQIPAWKRGSEHKVPPLTKKLFATDGCRRGKINFLQWSANGYINFTPGQAVQMRAQS